METSINNKCRAFTSLEQSRKLAEILPLESADMFWMKETKDYYEAVNVPYIESTAEEDDGLPCWSLAALLDVLPNGKDVSTTLSRGGWKIEPIEYIDNWWCEYEDDSHTKDFTVSADNPIDACYEMILKLHELKML